MGYFCLAFYVHAFYSLPGYLEFATLWKTACRKVIAEARAKNYSFYSVYFN